MTPHFDLQDRSLTNLDLIVSVGGSYCKNEEEDFQAVPQKIATILLLPNMNYLREEISHELNQTNK